MTENVGEKPSSRSVLGEDGRLSSASAAQSLKYARAQDLPSFPSTGGVQLSSAGAAASLASSQRKSFEHWKPGPIPAANKAALLAKDHKMEPLWQPEASAAGAGAALKAAANPIEVEPMQSRKPANHTNPGANYDTPEDTHKKAMMAATAVTHNRRRSGSAPMQPVSKQGDAAAAWALKAATQSHKAGPARGQQQQSQLDQPFASGDPGFEAAKIQNIAKNNVNRQMYTSSPPVSIEVQEKNRQDTLRASAVAMAQKMYAIQQKHIDEAAGKAEGQGQALAASRARGSTVSGSSVSDEHPAYGGGYENLEEAARKLAQERLAKIHDEHAEYRNYYGATSPQRRSRLSMRLGGDRSSRAANEDDDSDEENSRKIRSQMSIFKSNLAEVDTKKRQQDRDNLLQIAHRNVDSQISKMDERIFQDTGKASPAQMEKWEKAAREKAQRDSDNRQENFGKVHIGGGKYLDQSELDAIAKARLQPTLDEISEKAEKQRALDEERRLEEERQREQTAKEKARAAETAAQLKAENDRVKTETRAQKDEEKRVRDEEKRLRKEQENAERIKRDEERRAQKAAEVEEKERVRREKDMQRTGKETKPGRFSALFGRSGGAATSGTAGAGAASTTSTGVEAAGTTVGAGAASTPAPISTQDGTTEAASTPAPILTQVDTAETVHAPEGETIYEQVTVPTAESTKPVVVESLQEPTTTGLADTLVDPTATTRSAQEPSTVDKPTSLDENRTVIQRDAEPTSPAKSGVRSWMKTRFGRKSNAQEDRDVVHSRQGINDSSTKGNDVERDEMPRTDSMRDVAMAGRTTTNETEDMYSSSRAEVSPERPAGIASAATRDRSTSISSISSDEQHQRIEGETEPESRSFSLGTTTEQSDSEPRGRTGFRNKLMKKIKPGKEVQDEKAVDPVASNSEDEFEEARDTFQEESLAPPPALSTLTGEGGKSKPISPKGSREGSRFTEEL